MKKLHSPRAALCLAILGMSACTTTTNISTAAALAEDAAQLPALVRQSERNQQTLQALFMGRLHLDSNGCLRGDSDVGPIIIWHPTPALDGLPTAAFGSLT
jgi:hypothetical protein